MQEKILKGKKNGLAMLFLILLVYAAGIGIFAAGCVMAEAGTLMPLAVAMIVIGGLWMALGWLPLCGLKVLKPQEALVLTLFGNYVGTLKEEGFYYVNPFCTAVNPAAKTRLNQSGDVNDANRLMNAAAQAGTSEAVGKRISLKIMTLNNNRQKINDCLGNPV